MRFNTLCSCLLLLAAVQSHPEGSWKWESSGQSSNPTTVAPTVQPATEDSLHLSVADESGKLPSNANPHEQHEESSSTVDVETAADAIIHSTRTGKVINTYEAVYEDAFIQKALQEGKDTEARTYIKEKLCKLGLAKECAKVTGKSYGPSGFNGLHGGLGIDPNIVSYVQPVAIVPAGAPIAAVPLGLGGGHFKQQGKGQIGKVKGYGVPPGGYGAPSLLPPNSYGAPGLGGFGGLGSLAPPPIPASLPPAPVQHIHHHQTVGGPQIIPGPYSALPPPPPIYKSPPSYNPVPPAYNPPPRPSYSNPAPVYNPAPSRPYNPAPIQPYSNGGNNFAPRDQCVCVPVEQCPSYDVIGRVADYAIDPRSKLNSTIVADDDDIVIVSQAEGRQLAPGSESPKKESTRRRRQSIHHRQTIVGDDSVTIVSSDSSASQSPLNPPSGGASPIAPIAEFPAAGSDPVGGDLDSISVEAAGSAPAADGSVPATVGAPAAPGVVGAVGGSLFSALKKFIEPTFGVSFGLPGGAFGGGYPLNPLGTNPVVNPYGGAIGGDGVNFGSFNVNPLVSLQLGKGESGKKFRPLVNFHITPSAEKLAEKGLIGPGGVGSGFAGPGLGGLGGFGGPGLGGLGGLGGFGGGGFGGLPFRQLTKDGQSATQTDNSGLSFNNNQSPLVLSSNNYNNDYANQGVSSEPFRFAETTNTHHGQFNQSPESSSNNYYHDVVKQGGSDEPFRFASSSANAIRPLRSARDGRYGEEAPLNLGEVGQGLQRVGLASDEASFKTHHYEKSFKKAFGKGYGIPYPVATPVAIPQPYGVPYPQPVPVAQPVPYAVPQPVPVQIPVHIPVKIEVPVHVPVRVEVPVPIPVAAPYAVPIPVPYEQPVQVHQHYHHQHVPVPPAPLYPPPKASVYRPHPGVYGSPTYGYSGPVPSFSSAVASYGPTPYSNSGGKETSYTGQAQAGQYYAAASENNYPTAQVHTATGYDSVTVHAAPNNNNGYTFRDTTNDDGQPKTRTSGVRFVDSRSGESSSSPSSSSSTTSSAVKFEQSKRKRSAQEQDFVETDASQPETIEEEARDARQLGGSSYTGGFPTCSHSQVCCRSSPAANRYSNGAAPGTCGRRNPQGINGRIKTLPYADGEAEFGEYPWQVAILKKDQYDNVYVCGGALVGPSHILTAAHCIKGNAPGDLRVRLGEWDVNRESEFYPHIEKDVVSVLIHPEYYPGNLYNDIAVVKFEGAVDFGYNPHIAPACVPQRYQEFTGSRCWVTGWGKDAFGTGGKYQNILKEVDVPVVGNAECENKLRRTRLGYDFKLHSGFLCAGGEEGKDACKGDGGGPLVCESRGSWFLAGLVSWGVGCGQYDTPGVYTKVSEFSDWVQKNLIY